MEVFVSVIIVLILLFIFYMSRREGLKKTEEELALKKTEKEEWHKQQFMSFGEVQEARKNLETIINEQFKDDENKMDLFKEVIEEWADLKIKSFRERRSWVRRPKKHP